MTTRLAHTRRSPPAARTVVVAEDDVLVARDLRETLHELGYRVLDVVGSADAAVASARRQRPDLALLDIRMPGERDGVDAGRVLVEELGIPVVYLTAYGDDATLDRALAMRPHGYVVKPFDARELHAALQVALERSSVEARLRASEERLDATLRSIGEAVVTTDEEGRIRSLNSSAERLLGYREAEVTGRPVTDVVRFRSGPDGASLPNPILRALAEGRVVALEEGAVVETREGGLTPVSDSAAPVLIGGDRLTGGVLVIRDDSSVRRQEAALRQSEARFRQIAEHVQDVFWISSPDKATMHYVSPAYEDIWGRSCSELIEAPRTWFEDIHPEDRPKVSEALPRQSEPGGYELEYRIIRPDGQERWIWDRAFPVIGEGGEVTRIVGVAEDITRRVGLERRMAQGQKLEALGKLAGGVAHDFNNLLTVIQSQVALVLDDLADDDGSREDLELVLRSAVRAAELTRKLLAFSRDQVLRPQPVNLDRVVRDMGRFLERLLGESVRVEYDLAGDLPAVQIDPGQLEQVVMNLAVNARDAMPENGVLTLSTREETLAVADVQGLPGLEAGRYVALEVVDSGVGMTEEVLARIFDPFFTTRPEGTGLGLAMVYGIVKQSGGAIHVESSPGRGSRFTLRFPPTDADAVDLRRDRVPTVAAATADGYRIAVVEDDGSVGGVTRRVLERHGHRVQLFADAESALDALRDGPPPDVLVSDLGLPGMSGPELIRAARAIHPDLAVLAVSGYARGSLGPGVELPEDVVFLTKPFTPSGLVDAVRRAFEESHGD